MIWAIIFTIAFFNILIWLSSLYRRHYWLWTGCPVCGSMVELHREVFDKHQIWRGQCDLCYSRIIEYFSEI